MRTKAFIVFFLAQFALSCAPVDPEASLQEGVRWAEATSDGNVLGVSYSLRKQHSIWAYSIKEKKLDVLVKGLKNCPSIVRGSTREHVIWSVRGKRDLSKSITPDGSLVSFLYLDGKTGVIREIPQSVACLSVDLISNVLRVLPESGVFLCRRDEEGMGRYVTYSLADFQERMTTQPTRDYLVPSGGSLLLSPNLLLLTANVFQDESSSPHGDSPFAIVPVAVATQALEAYPPIPIPSRSRRLGNAGNSSAVYAISNDLPYIERVVLERTNEKLSGAVGALSENPFARPGKMRPIGAWGDRIICGNLETLNLEVWAVSSGQFVQTFPVGSWSSDSADAAVSETSGRMVCFGNGHKVEVFDPLENGYQKIDAFEVVVK